ncbi:hypothetical protein ACQ4LE_010449, partial [Meloidogyne hapla]
MQYMCKIAETLAGAGHEVHFIRVIISEFEMELPQNLHKVYDIIPKGQSKVMDPQTIPSIQNPFKEAGTNRFLFPRSIWDDLKIICEGITNEFINNQLDFIEQMKKENFDVGISEFFDHFPFALFHIIGTRTKLAALAVPVLQGAARQFGIPTFSSFVTNIVSPVKSAPTINFLDRIVNFVNDLYEYFIITDIITNLEELILKNAYGEQFPSLKSIGRNISFLFVNSNPFFEMPRPISNKIVSIGGIVDMRAETLDTNIEHLFSNARSGVVLVSFGSMVDTKRMEKSQKLAFLRAFASFPEYTFIWKYEFSDDQDAKLFVREAPNVHAFKWMDQKSILLHPKLSAFITHCGQNSVTEAARAGAPVLGVPLFGDQLFNAIMAKFHGMAVLLDMQELNGNKNAENLIIQGLNKVLKDQSYRKNAQIISRKIAQTPFSPKERLIKWVEFAAQFPPLNELNLPSDEEMGLLAYYSLDVIGFSMIILVGFLLILFYIFRYILNFIFYNRYCDRDIDG